jgi:Xaa-Pro aminopeptidase
VQNNKETDIREALKTAADVYDALRRAVRPGATEKELERAVLAAAEGREARFDLLTGPRTAGVEGGATDRVLQPGDPVLLDLCLKTGEHWCDVCRTFFLGAPEEAAWDAYRKVLGCFELTRAALRPGAEASALYREAKAYFAQNGMRGWTRHHTGHAVGRTPFQPPVEIADSRDVLSEGDVMTVEIGVYLDGRFGIRVEDDFLLTGEGAAPLWSYPKTLESATIELKEEG